MKRNYTIDDWNEAFLAIDRNSETRKKCINKFNIDRKSRILEIGCGDGVNLKVLHSIGCENIFGMDISMELLSKAKEYKCICSDIYNLGFRDNSFDGIYCKGVLHHVNIKKVFGELGRILRPGGAMYILEPWPTFFRKIADFLTLYILCYFSKTLYYRKVGLDFEKEMYGYWLKSCKTTLFEEIKKHNLKVVYRHRSLFDLYITVQKREFIRNS